MTVAALDLGWDADLRFFLEFTQADSTSRVRRRAVALPTNERPRAGCSSPSSDLRHYEPGFLDIGTGLPSAPNTHQVAQRAAPRSRVVYVDNDPIVLAHARALLTSRGPGRTDYIEADLRDPGKLRQGRLNRRRSAAMERSPARPRPSPCRPRNYPCRPACSRRHAQGAGCRCECQARSTRLAIPVRTGLPVQSPQKLLQWIFS